TKGSAQVTLGHSNHNEPYLFAVKQPISGPGIPLGATIVAVSSGSLTLSAPATESGTEGLVSSSRADLFTVGEQISGYGLPAGTRVTGVGSGTLTVSAAADVSAGGVALQAGGECTEAAKACTI